jgi:hypothetical protein
MGKTKDLTYPEILELEAQENKRLEESKSRVESVRHVADSRWKKINGKWVKTRVLC